MILVMGVDNYKNSITMYEDMWKLYFSFQNFDGAGEGTRTLDPQLGRLTL